MIMWYFINPHWENLFLSATLLRGVRGQAQLHNLALGTTGRFCVLLKDTSAVWMVVMFLHQVTLPVCLPACLPSRFLCESLVVVEAICEALVAPISITETLFFFFWNNSPEQSVRRIQTCPLLYKLQSQFAFWIERAECELSSGVSLLGVCIALLQCMIYHFTKKGLHCMKRITN